VRYERKKEGEMMENILKESKEFKLLFEKSLNLLSGKYSSKIKGDGLEFVDLKEYLPGDDVRRIDWKVTAREGKVFTREYLEEKDASQYVLIDTSRSMDNKLFGAKVLGASLLLSSLNEGNSFSIGFFNSKQNSLFSLTKNRNQLMKYIYNISNIKTDGSDGIDEILIKILNLVSKKSIISIITDEMELNERTKSLLFALNKKHKVNYFQIYSSSEKNLEVGLNSFEDVETGYEGIYDLDEDEIEEYKKEFDRRLSEVKNQLISIGIRPFSIDSDFDLKTQILKQGGKV